MGAGYYDMQRKRFSRDGANHIDIAGDNVARYQQKGFVPDL